MDTYPERLALDHAASVAADAIILSGMMAEARSRLAFLGESTEAEGYQDGTSRLGIESGPTGLFGRPGGLDSEGKG